jgi:23S rRNA (guanosine2251-2'-O)-methyltransferase
VSEGSRKVAVIEGARPVIEALRAGRRRVHEIQIPRGEGSPALHALRETALQHRVPVSAGAAGTAVRALADPYPEVVYEELLGGSGPRRLVALDGVTDVGNLGSIARSAEVAGATGLVLEQRRSPPINPGALRASAGALEHLRVSRVPSLRRALELARGEGLTILAAAVGAPPLAEVDPALLEGDLLLLLGSEDRGIRRGLRELAGIQVGIPALGRTESLGVAAAGAYLLLRLAEPRGRGEGIPPH